MVVRRSIPDRGLVARPGCPGLRGPGARRGLRALTYAGTLLVLGGCSTPVNPGTPSVSAPYVSVTPPATPEPLTEVTATLTSGDLPRDLVVDPPPFPAALEPSVAAASSSAALTVTDVRVAAHPGFDRVVFEMGGNGMPGWTVGYVSQAVQASSGMLLEIEGRATLWVSISGSGYPSATGSTPFTHSTPVRGDGTAAVTEVQGWSAFEGTTESFVGVVEHELPYRVFLLDDPVRVVVDVEHPRP